MHRGPPEADFNGDRSYFFNHNVRSLPIKICRVLAFLTDLFLTRRYGLSGACSSCIGFCELSRHSPTTALGRAVCCRPQPRGAPTLTEPPTIPLCAMQTVQCVSSTRVLAWSATRYSSRRYNLAAPHGQPFRGPRSSMGLMAITRTSWRTVSLQQILFHHHSPVFVADSRLPSVNL